VVSDRYANFRNYRYLISKSTQPIADTDNRYYGSCIYSVYSVMRNNRSVGDHVTALSYKSSSLGLALIT